MSTDLSDLHDLLFLHVIIIKNEKIGYFIVILVSNLDSKCLILLLVFAQNVKNLSELKVWCCANDCITKFQFCSKY